MTLVPLLHFPYFVQLDPQMPWQRAPWQRSILVTGALSTPLDLAATLPMTQGLSKIRRSLHEVLWAATPSFNVRQTPNLNPLHPG